MRVKPELKRNNHLLTVSDLNAQEVRDILHLMKLLKDAERDGVRLPLLKDKVLGMIFEINSTRTRISFETAMTQLGGHAEFLSMKNLWVGEGHESMRDTAEVISRMTDGVIMRCVSQESMELFARYSYVPVFNGMTLDYHPTQALADVFTMMEHLPHRSLEDMTIMYLGDNNAEYGNNTPVQTELMHMAALLGMTYIACAPDEMQVCPRDEAAFNRLAAKSDSGARLIKTSDPFEYISDVDFTVSDAFCEGADEHSETTRRRRALLFPRYQVNQELVNAGKPSLGVLHCLPGQRDEEITSEVWDGPNSLLFEEAENRLNAQKAIVAWFMYADPVAEATQMYHMGKVQGFLRSATRTTPAGAYRVDHSEK